MRLALVLFFSGAAFSQDLTDATKLPAARRLTIPSLKPFANWDPPNLKERDRSGFLRTLRIESLGYGLQPSAQGFENPLRFTTGDFLAHGFECPRCISRPTSDRTRYTLPAFGATATLSLWHGRGEVFTGFGGINAWRPDNTTIEPNMRTTSFNNAWLPQGVAGARLALDKGGHLWLGVAGRYVENLGEGKRHWNTLTGTLTYDFGR